MRKNIFSLLLLFTAAGVSAQESGVFLTLPLSPRAGGMGDASVALADDPLGLYYNPAGMVFAKRPAVSAIYHKYLQDINGNSFAFVYPFKNWAIGIAPTVFSMKEEPIYDSLGAATGEKFGYESKIIPIALAGRIGNLALGFAGKSYSEDIGGQASATTAYDIGAIYRLGKLSFGAAMQNLGGKIFDYDVVKVQRAGVAYSGDKYSAAADLKKEGEDKAFLGLGGGYVLSKTLKLRGGWQLKDEFGGVTFGLGLELGGLNFDYAFLSYGDLGATHKAAISLAFGEKPAQQRAEAPRPVEPVAVNTAPALDWTGEENYAAVGLSTGSGNTGTLFVYRVKYLDAEGDNPADGYPRVHINKNGGEIPGSPFAMEYISGDNKGGAIYAYTQQLAAGNNYSYNFEAKDSRGAAAAGAPMGNMAGPMVSRLEVVRISGGTNIAVAEFVGKNVSQADASIVTDFLRTELVSAGLFNVMDRNNMDTVLAEQKFQNSGCTEQECAVEMGKLLNIKQVLVGSLSKLLDSYYVTVNVVDVETGKISASYNSDGVSSKELKDVCRKIVKNLSQK